MKPTLKTAGIVAHVAIFLLLYNISLQQAERVMNVRIISGFGGWAMANNAIHIYNVTTVDSNIFEEGDEVSLHKAVLALKDSAYNYAKNPRPTDQYLWNRKGPLKQFQAYDEKRVGFYLTHLQSWWGQAPLFNEFGLKLIRNYPGAFFKAFYWPNFKEFFYPNPEVLTYYNFNKQPLNGRYMQFLGLHGESTLTSAHSNLQKHTVAVIRGIYAVLTPLSMLFCLAIVTIYIARMVRTKFKMADTMLTTAFTLSLFYLVTTALLVFAHPVLMRYISMLLIFFNILPFIAYKALMSRNEEIITEEK